MAGRVVREPYDGWWEVTFEGLSVIVPTAKLRRAGDAETPSFAVDAPVLVAWRGRWYEGRVLQPLGRELWEIRYEGYDASWNEAVGAERIRARPEPSPFDLATCVPGAAVQ